MKVDLVHTQTSDGMRLDGVLHEVNSNPTSQSDLDAIICFSGIGSNFYGSSLIARICDRLGSHGVAALSVNTRGHDGISTASTTFGGKRQGAAFEIIDDCRYDVSAWIQFLTKQGHRRIGLLGHSLGAIKVVYAQAYASEANVARVIALSPPSLNHRRFLDSKDASDYRRSLEAAETFMAAGAPEMIFQATFPFSMAMSPATYLDKYGSADRYDILRFANQVNCPLAFIYGSKELQAEQTAFAGITDQLERLTWPATGRPTIDVIPGANHFYAGVVAELLDEISRIVTS